MSGWAAAALVALGSAGGGVARYALSTLLERRLGGRFPWATLAVNLSGSLAIGGLMALSGADEATTREPALQLLLAVGFLGSYTTVSSFSLQTLELMQDGKQGRAGVYVLGSVAGCLLAAAFGWGIIRSFLA